MTATPNSKRHLLWPILITSLICIHIVSVVTMVIVATHDRSFAVEPDFYQKGLHYDQAIQQRRENDRLGWSVKVEVSQPLSGTNMRNVTCRLMDRDGKPLEGAKIDLAAFAHLRASNVQTCALVPQDTGQYAGTIAFADPGIWEFRLVVAHGKDTFAHVVRQQI
jgi:nitrogen fixation protein FixH